MTSPTPAAKPLHNTEGMTILRGSGEWSALYDGDGMLVIYGDHYLIDNKLQELFGITTEHTDAQFRRTEPTGQDKYGREYAAASLREWNEWVAEDEANLEKIRALRAEADALEEKVTRR